MFLCIVPTIIGKLRFMLNQRVITDILQLKMYLYLYCIVFTIMFHTLLIPVASTAICPMETVWIVPYCLGSLKCFNCAVYNTILIQYQSGLMKLLLYTFHCQRNNKLETQYITPILYTFYSHSYPGYSRYPWTMFNMKTNSYYTNLERYNMLCCMQAWKSVFEGHQTWYLMIHIFHWTSTFALDKKRKEKKEKEIGLR